MVENGFTLPIIPPFVITQTYKEHLEYAAAHPGIAYNGGIDLYSDDRTIRAAFGGKVEKVAYQAGGYGNYIKLRHSWGFSLYAHMERIYAHVDNLVDSGTSIGLMGSTGFSTGIHLHFELRDLTEKVLDPTEYFETPTTIETDCRHVLLVSGVGGNLRKTPLGEFITTIPHGTVGKIIDGPVYRNGLPCYQVEFPITGWIAERDDYGNKILEDYGD